MRTERFGAMASGARLERMEASPNYKAGKFQNLHNTPALTEGYSMGRVMIDWLFKSKPRKYPIDPIPSVKNDLLALSADGNYLVWFGHSSYFLQVDGLKYLIDPVFSGSASPVYGTTKAFKGTDIYSVSSMPEIDYLIITHDHYDHLDYETVLALRKKVKKVICGLGVGAHFEKWGYDAHTLIETDWFENVVLNGGVVLHTKPARHFSGRGLRRDVTLWQSYLLETPSMRIYIGGDSGYDSHFVQIGNQHGPIDLAILDNGQYDEAWKYIHTHPSEVLQAGIDLRAKRIFPVHSMKFQLGNHAWDEPLKLITLLNETVGIPLVTPMIGEVVDLKDTTLTFKKWWEGLN